MKQPYFYDIIRLQTKLNAEFKIRAKTQMRTLNQNTLCRMQEYIANYQRENGLSPSYRKIMHALGMSSLNLVQRYVLALERNGRIRRTDLGSIQTPLKLRRGKITVAPLVGEIACGSPTDSVENIEESFALPQSLFGSGELFMLRAFGDSMIDIGIQKDDLLVLRKQDYANDGDVVVALTNGQTTLKRLFHKGNKIVLHPENKTMEDIIVTDCQVQGVLISCIKMY